MTAYGLMGDIVTPLVFVLIGVITAYYNKNMLIILFISLIFSNIVKYGNKLAINMEGFSENLKGKTEPNEMDDTNPAGNTKKIKDETVIDNEDTNDETGMMNKPNKDENKDAIKHFKVMKEEMDNLLQNLEDKLSDVNKELNSLQEKIKMKAKQSGVTIK